MCKNSVYLHIALFHSDDLERLFHCDVYLSVFPVCIRVLNIYMRLYGAKDGRVGVAMCSLARVKCATGIILFHKKALNIHAQPTSLFISSLSDGMYRTVSIHVTFLRSNLFPHFLLLFFDLN